MGPTKHCPGQRTCAFARETIQEAMSMEQDFCKRKNTERMPGFGRKRRKKIDMA
jgi:hypothetical protein